jgi:hypothetical protein
VAELEGRVTLLDGSNAAVAHLGDNPNQDQWGNPTVPPAAWRAGMFTAPMGSRGARTAASTSRTGAPRGA